MSPGSDALQADPSDRALLWDRFGETPVLETGAEWFDRQDSSTQRIVLGPGKFALFEAGDLEFIDLVREVDDSV